MFSHTKYFGGSFWNKRRNVGNYLVVQVSGASATPSSSRQAIHTMKRRGLKGFDEGSSSSDDDNDGFAAIAEKSKRQRVSSTDDPVADEAEASSSSKRHHHVNAIRQAKMNALLQELQTTKASDPSTAANEDYGRLHDDDNYCGHSRPHKMGSYVEPGQEHLTTNIFVGNLDPMSTEEELTDVFRQFGETCLCIWCGRMCGWCVV